MFGHLTFLFENRPLTSENGLLIQNRMCLDILENIILKYLHNNLNTITKDLWDTSIRLIIAIIDSLSTQKQTLINNVQDLSYLVAPAFRSGIEILLLSQSQDMELWNYFTKLIPSWIRPKVVQHWSSALYGITLKTLSIIYGPKFGHSSEIDSIVIEWTAEETITTRSKIPSTPEFTFFSWRCIIAMTPDPLFFKDRETHRVFFEGISRLVESYLKVADQGHLYSNSCKKKLPNINSILVLFGRWLFNSLLTDKVEFDEGNSVAIRILCQIFCRSPNLPKIPVDKNYLASFYAVLSLILSKPINNKVLITLILHMKYLFVLNYPGSLILIQPLFYMLSSVWHDNTDPIIKSPILDLVSSLISLPSLLHETKVLSKNDLKIIYGSTLNIPQQIKTFSVLREHLNVFFMKCITKEENPRIISKILQLIVVFLYDSILDNQIDKMTNISFFTVITNEILRRCREVWNYEAIVSAYVSISSLSEIYKYLGNDGPKIAKIIIFSLTEHIDTLSSQNLQQTESPKIIQYAMSAMLNWWMIDPKISTIIDNSVVVSAIKSVIYCFKFGKNLNSIQPSSSLKYFVEFALSCIATSTDFPSSIGAHRISSEISELDIIKTIPNLDNNNPMISQYVRHFMFENQTIMTLIDVPKSEFVYESTLYMVLRRYDGKHIWKANLKLYDDSKILNPPPKLKPGRPLATQPLDKNLYQKGITTGYYSDLENNLSSLWKQKNRSETMLDSLQSYLKTEKDYLEKNSYYLNKDIQFRSPETEKPYKSKCRFHAGTFFLSNLGLLHPETFKHITHLNAKPEFLQSLNVLDEMPERMTLSIGILYMTKNSKTKFDYLLDQSDGTKDFKNFLASLGSQINISEHTGFRGPFTSYYKLDRAIYYSNFSTEILFPISNWIPASQSPENTISRKIKLLSSSPILIVWCSQYQKYTPPPFKRNFCHIIIHPSSLGLFRIEICTLDNRNYGIGPLINDMQISKHILAPLLRETAINYSKLFLTNSFLFSSFIERKLKIEQISESFSRNCNFGEFVASLFSTKPSFDFDYVAISPKSNILDPENLNLNNYLNQPASSQITNKPPKLPNNPPPPIPKNLPSKIKNLKQLKSYPLNRPLPEPKTESNLSNTKPTQTLKNSQPHKTLNEKKQDIEDKTKKNEDKDLLRKRSFVTLENPYKKLPPPRPKNHVPETNFNLK